MFSKKGVYSREATFHFHFYPQQALDVWLPAASRVQGVLGTCGSGVTYDALLISSILHAQNKLREFQLHSSHALPQCQLSAARRI